MLLREKRSLNARACRACNLGVVACFQAWRGGPGRCCEVCAHRPRRRVRREVFVAHALSQGLTAAEAETLAGGSDIAPKGPRVWNVLR